MKLSILIPSANEIFLRETVNDALKNIRDDTEINITLDGAWADPGIYINDRVNIIYCDKSIGQRSATNLAAKLSKAKYVMKLDAHCSFDEGFDKKMIDFMERVGDDVVSVPVMRNLWSFDWKCFDCGWRKYQGPTPEKCENCGKVDKIQRKMMWIGKHNPQSTSFSFDSEPHFQYFNAYKVRPEYIESKEKNGYTESMSLQGSCFMATRKKYWELGLCDERLGNWGNQGIEVACKTWLSGGRVLVNHNTWYAHMFRTQGGDFGFPWNNNGKEVAKTKQNVKELFWNNKWNKQNKPLSWLIKKFMPIPGWTDEKIKELDGNSI